MAAITAAAIGAGGAIFAAKKSSDASKNAAKTAAQGQTQALDATSRATAEARGDVNRLFGTAADARNQGFQRALDFTAGSIPQQIAPFQQGNVMAQEQLGRGLQQQQNALFGGPVDLSGFQARQIGQPQDFALNLPQAQQPGTPTQQPQPPVATGSPLGGGGFPSGVNVNPPGIGGLGQPAGGFFGGGMPSSNIFGAGIPSRNIFGGFTQSPDFFQQTDPRLL